MDPIRWSINKPVSVAVGVILVVMFGLIGLGAIPIQLTPTVDRPNIEVTTRWPGRSPQEIVDNITREQEKRLKNVSNLKRMRSTSTEGQSTISLEFYLGADISRALQEVSDSLRQVPSYPAEVDEPTIKAADGASENAIAWIIVDVDPAKRHKHPDFDITTLYDALDKEVKPYLERIGGVAEVNVFGGREREVRVLLDPVKLAQRRLTFNEVIGALQAENRNISAGSIAEGKRDYRVRIVGQFATEQDVLDTIVAYRPAADAPGAALKPVYVRDLGDVEFGHTKKRGFVRSLGQPCIAINTIRQANANVVEVMAELRSRLDEVRADILPKLGGEVGPDLRIRQVYDETTYIDSAIDLVSTNLWVGGIIATLVLLVFLRSFTATGVVALAIPISVIGTFLAMVAFGRTLNVISLAGLAFATGMVVDNAIVVLENTVRRVRAGDSPRLAAYWGAKEVWVAVLASTLTTVAVFVPVLTIKEEAGQLFRDISLAIAAAVLFSLVVSITVIPSAGARLLSVHRPDHERSALRRNFDRLFGLAPLLQRLADRVADGLMWIMTGWRGWTLRPAIIIAMASLSLWGSMKLMPPLDYLPTGNRNLVFGGLLIPPGYSVEQQESIATRIEQQIRPYIEVDAADRAAVAALPPIPRFPPGMAPFEPVPINNFFIAGFNGGMFCGATSAWPEVVIPVGGVLTNAMNTIPDAFGGARQSAIFGRGVGGGNSVKIEISGPDLSRVIAAAQFMFLTAGAEQGGYGMRNVQPEPSNFLLGQPEATVRLNQHGRELGLTVRDVGVAVRGLFDGAFIDDFRLGGDTVDMVLLPRSGRLEYQEQLAAVPVATPAGPVVPLDTVVTLERTTAPQAIQRSEELPSVTISIAPPVGITVDEVMTRVREDFLPRAQAAGLIDASMRVRLEGTAASLDEVRAALFGQAQTGAPLAGWQRGLLWVCGGLCVLGALAAAYSFARGFGLLARRGRVPRSGAFYGAVSIMLLTTVVVGLLAGVTTQPQFMTARFVWALLVTYLLMCSVFESFLYPLVIMFSVPLAVVGGFAGLRIVHDITLADPTIAPQQLDVLTMLGFVILIGTVVNNSILIVEQSLNFEDPRRYGAEGERMPIFRAIRASVASRFRPIFMTTCTTLGGMLPLVVSPGSGSEMYRGLGAVVLGGLACSTVFTLLLVPLVFSLVVQMKEGVNAAFGRASERMILDPVPAGMTGIAIPASATRPDPAPSPSNGDGVLAAAKATAPTTEPPKSA
ncbi:MAG: efflux RND transporter permease subunit [Phycisphaeraceae bacterium]|nr:efflux RND transporter permease subunit [Phycisphaeraceae bacterium]